MWRLFVGPFIGSLVAAIIGFIGGYRYGRFRDEDRRNR